MTAPAPARLPWGYLVALAALLLVITNALVVGESPRPRRRARSPEATRVDRPATTAGGAA